MPISTKHTDSPFFQTKESLKSMSETSRSFSIGIPKEHAFQENRIALSPLSVGLLVERGHQVLIERGAGKGSNFLDTHYSEQGAQIVDDVSQVYASDVIVKISSPSLKDVELMKNKQILLSSQLPNLIDREVLNALMRKQITAFSYEYLQDEEGNLSIVQAMGEIVGSTSVLIAAEYLSNVFGGKGLMLGGITGIPPTEMVIIGADTIGEYAAKTALALGVQVKVFDQSVYKLKRLQNNVGSKNIYTSVIQPVILNKAVQACDVVIGALVSDHGNAPCILSEDVISNMKPNSVLIDTSMAQGGCFETSEITSHDKPVFRKYDVIHYCVPNIASRVARTATYAMTNILTSLLLRGAECGGLKSMVWSDHRIRSAVYLYNGTLTNKDIADKFGLSAKDLDLLVVSNF